MELSRRGLIDSNVLVAAAALDHDYHESSSRWLQPIAPGEFATALHCLSEFYNVATRRYKVGAEPIAPRNALTAIERFSLRLEVLELSRHQHFEAIRLFSMDEGRGPRLYDFLIGRVAVVHDIPLIVTWNVKHFVPLFPRLRVATPEQLLQEI